MPAMGYVSMAIEALTQTLETIGKFDPHCAFYLREVYIQKPLIIDEPSMDNVGTEVYTTLRPFQLNSEDESKWYEFRIRSTGANSESVKHSMGQICVGQRKPSEPLPSIKGRNIEGEKFYRAMDQAGFDHGPAFRALQSLRARSDGFRMHAQMVNYTGVRDESNKNAGQGDTLTTLERDRKGSDSQEQALNGEGQHDPDGKDIEPDGAIDILVTGTASPRTHTESPYQDEASSGQGSLSGSPKIILTPVTSSTPSIRESDTGCSGQARDPVVHSFAQGISQEEQISLTRKLEAGVPPEQEATATGRLLRAQAVSNVESRYAVHPVNLDMSVQLTFGTLFAGQLSKINDIVVPIFFESIYVASPAPEASPLFDIYCTVEHLRTAVFPLTQCVSWDSTGQEIININNIRALELGQSLYGQKSMKAVDHFRLHWEIDFDFVDQGNFEEVLRINLPGNQNRMVMPKKELYDRQYFLLLLAMQVLDTIRGLDSPADAPAYMQLYKQWLEHLFLDEQKESLRTLCGKEEVNITLLSSAERQQEIETLASSLQADEECKLAYEISQNIIPLFRGEKDPSTFNNNVHSSQMSHYETAFARLYSRKYPQRNVLEIGGGAGEGTEAILKGTTSDAGGEVMERCFMSYTFTDADSANVAKAKERLSAYSGMEFVTLDIEKDLAEQGLEGKYDIIYALNVG